MRSVCKAMVLLIAVFLVVTACGDSKPATPQKPSQSPKDKVALALIQAFRTNDCEGIASVSTGSLNKYYEALGKMKGILEEVIVFYEGEYPNDLESPILTKLRMAWKKPILFYKDLKLDGALAPEEATQNARYRISWESTEGKRVQDAMVLTRVDGLWRVRSIGEFSPKSEQVAAIRTQLNQLEFTYKEGLQAVRDQKPANIMQAHFLFSQVRAKLMEEKK